MAGNALGFDGTNNPDAVAADPVLAFRTALWFWMTPQSPKPSAHDVMAGRWTPSAADAAAGRTPGFGGLGPTLTDLLANRVVISQACPRGGGKGPACRPQFGELVPAFTASTLVSWGPLCVGGGGGGKAAFPPKV
jgi:hypothetical protein